MQLETHRLILRPFAEQDIAEMAQLNADPQVMRFFPAPYTEEQTRAMIDIWATKLLDHGYAFSAVERKEDNKLLGMAGLSRLEKGAPIAPCTEIGWRFAADAWGQGFASEAARAWLDYGFKVLNLPEILSFAPKLNLPSLKVMERIGMHRCAELDFEHPIIPEGHDLRPMSVYRLKRAEFCAPK